MRAWNVLYMHMLQLMAKHPMKHEMSLHWQHRSLQVSSQCKLHLRSCWHSASTFTVVTARVRAVQQRPGPSCSTRGCLPQCQGANSRTILQFRMEYKLTWSQCGLPKSSPWRDSMSCRRRHRCRLLQQSPFISNPSGPCGSPDARRGQGSAAHVWGATDTRRQACSRCLPGAGTISILQRHKRRVSA